MTGLPREWLSWSQISLFHRCPACYESSYIRGEEEAHTSLALPIGTAVHAAAAFARKARMTDMDYATTDIEDVAISAYRDSLQATQTRGWDLASYKDVSAPERDVAAFGRTVVSELVEREDGIVGVEEEFWMPEGLVDAPFKGFIDVRMKVDGQTTIRDLKTTTRRSAPDSWAGWQLATYALSGWQALDYPTLGIDQLIKTQKPGVASWRLEVTDELCETALSLIRSALEGILAGRFPPRPSVYPCRYFHSGTPSFSLPEAVPA